MRVSATRPRSLPIPCACITDFVVSLRNVEELLAERGIEVAESEVVLELALDTLREYHVLYRHSRHENRLPGTERC